MTVKLVSFCRLFDAFSIPSLMDSISLNKNLILHPNICLKSALFGVYFQLYDEASKGRTSTDSKQQQMLCLIMTVNLQKITDFSHVELITSLSTLLNNQQICLLEV